MEKSKLLKQLKTVKNDVDAINMILSNYVDYGSSTGGMVSVKQFSLVAECIIEWSKDRWKEKPQRICPYCIGLEIKLDPDGFCPNCQQYYDDYDN